MATYLEDLAAAGYIGWPFSWDDDGVCTYYDDVIKAEDRDAIEAIFTAHASEKPFLAIPLPPAPLAVEWAPGSPMREPRAPPPALAGR